MKVASQVLLFSLFVLCGTNVSAKPSVLTSIKPLALLARSLLEDLAEIEILLPPAADPHHYSLTVSDRKRIEEADLILWLGPTFERFLHKTLATVDDNRKYALTNIGGLSPSSEAGGVSEDQHLWLDPRLAILIQQAIAEKMMASYPELRAAIQVRLERQHNQLVGFHQELGQRLQAYRGQGFIADHPAYKHLAQAFDLRQIGVVFLQPDLAPGARHLQSLSELVVQERPRCLLREMGHASPTLNQWAKRWQLHIVDIDILAVQADIRSYGELMESMSDSLQRCFQKR